MTPPVKNPRAMDPRFKSPRFRAAVRKVLSSMDEDTTYANFQKYDRQHGAILPINWYEFARNVGIPQPCHKQGVYLVTHTGAEIELELCLESINELTEYNRRLKP